MDNEKPSFHLPPRVDQYLATISTLYAQEGNRQLQELVVNGQPRVHEAWNTDNWNGGTYGHAIYLQVPASIYVNSVAERESIQDRIKEDLNRIHNIKNEYVEHIFLEMDTGTDSNWRSESGLFLPGKKSVGTEAIKRIWGESGFRVFLSHKSRVKKQTALLKEELAQFGISAFVAHENIEPTQTWQDEIESALSSMDGFIALMTEDFHESDWTDQEIGFAFGRNVPIIAVNLGRTPYGFIGKFQALPSDWQNVATDIVKLWINQERMLSAYINGLKNCLSFSTGNKVAEVLPHIKALSPQQIDELVTVYNTNPQLSGSYGFTGSKPTLYGLGLAHYLSKFDPTRTFTYDRPGVMKVRKKRTK